MRSVTTYDDRTHQQRTTNEGVIMRGRPVSQASDNHDVSVAASRRQRGDLLDHRRRRATPLQHSYSKFAADARSSDHTPRPEDSAGHDATDPVTIGATTVGRRCADEHRCEANVATIGTFGRARPLECARRDPADPSRTRHFTSIHTYSTETEETR